VKTEVCCLGREMDEWIGENCSRLLRCILRDSIRNSGRKEQGGKERGGLRWKDQRTWLLLHCFLVKKREKSSTA
jgi:hypothetical protein